MLSNLLSFLKSKTRRTSRRNNRRHTRTKKGKRCNKHYRKLTGRKLTGRKLTGRKLTGGNYRQFTSETIQGIPVIKEAFVDIPGRGAVSLTEFNEYIENQAMNGKRM